MVGRTYQGKRLSLRGAPWPAFRTQSQNVLFAVAIRAHARERRLVRVADRSGKQSWVFRTLCDVSGSEGMVVTQCDRRGGRGALVSFDMRGPAGYARAAGTSA